MEPTNGSHPIVRDFENCYLSPHQHAPYALSFPKVSVLLSVIYNIITSGLCGISSIFNISVCLTRKFFEKPARYCMYYIQSLKSWLLRISTFFHVSMRLEYLSLQYFQLKKGPPPPLHPLCTLQLQSGTSFLTILVVTLPLPPTRRDLCFWWVDMGWVWMSHGTHMYESRYGDEGVMAHICMSHGTEMKESWHTYVYVMVHICMCHGFISFIHLRATVSLIRLRLLHLRATTHSSSLMMMTSQIWWISHGVPWCGIAMVCHGLFEWIHLRATTHSS